MSDVLKHVNSRAVASELITYETRDHIRSILSKFIMIYRSFVKIIVRTRKFRSLTYCKSLQEVDMSTV